MTGFRDPRAKHFALGRLKTGERNKTEAAYEQHLQLRLRAGDILWFKFEALKFRLADNTFLTPDFALMTSEGFIEIHDTKPSLTFIQDDAKVKMKVAAEGFPFRFFYVVPKKKRDGGGWDIVPV
jgi:hypothetical protein